MISTQAVRQAELHAARQTARATEAEAKAARLIEAPPAYDTAEGERILKERLDELRRGTLDALRAAEAKNEQLTAENAAAQLCLLYTSPSPRDQRGSRMPSSA